MLSPRQLTRRPAARRAVAAPVAPLVAAGLEPAGAALRAAVLDTRPAGDARDPAAARALERLGPPSSTAGSASPPSTCAAAAAWCSARPARPGAASPTRCSRRARCRGSSGRSTIGGREYVDGGAWSAANLDAAPVGRGTEVLCLNPTATPRLSPTASAPCARSPARGASTEALLLRSRGARVRIVAPDAGAVAAIGPNLFDPRRRAAVEAAGYAPGPRASFQRMSDPDHVAQNKASWEAEAANYVEPAKRDWAREEICWGMYRVPEADVGALPDVDGMDVVELGCGTAYFSSWLARRGARPPASTSPRTSSRPRARCRPSTGSSSR